MTKVKLGDVYEVATRKGLAYIQYVFENSFVGEFVRVIPGFFEERPPDDVARSPSRLLVCYPLRAALKQGLVHKVFWAAVPEAYSEFPTMRIGGNWLWDGEREWQEPRLRQEHHRLPHRTTLAHGTLVGYIEAELTDEEIDEEGRPRRSVDYPQDDRRTAARTHEEAGHHYLYFAKPKKAERAKKVIEGFGLTATLREAADGDDWLLLVTTKGALEEEQDLLERIAEGNDGEYDGSEVSVV